MPAKQADKIVGDVEQFLSVRTLSSYQVWNIAVQFSQGGRERVPRANMKSERGLQAVPQAKGNSELSRSLEESQLACNRVDSFRGSASLVLTHAGRRLPGDVTLSFVPVSNPHL